MKTHKIKNYLKETLISYNAHVSSSENCNDIHLFAFSLESQIMQYVYWLWCKFQQSSALTVPSM